MMACVASTLGWVGVVEGQCADGTVDAPVLTGTVAGCAGAWNAPGLVTADGNPVAPGCDRLAGNDGDYPSSLEMEAAGIRCTPADLCAPGWGLCSDADADATASGPSCAEVSAGTVNVLYVAATASCGSELGAQVVGCGSLGCASDFEGPFCSLFERQSDGSSSDPCATLNLSECNEGVSVDAGWSCMPAAATDEPVTRVTKEKASGGGVLCCFREVCDCVGARGECYADGEVSAVDECLVCEAGPMLGAPLTTIEGCGVDGGVSDADGGSGVLDGGAPPEVDLGGAEPMDLGAGPNDADSGMEPQPGVSFLGAGGCECRTGGPGAPAFGGVALILFALRRRR